MFEDDEVAYELLPECVPVVRQRMSIITGATSKARGWFIRELGGGMMVRFQKGSGIIVTVN